MSTNSSALLPSEVESRSSPLGYGWPRWLASNKYNGAEITVTSEAKSQKVIQLRLDSDIYLWRPELSRKLGYPEATRPERPHRLRGPQGFANDPDPSCFESSQPRYQTWVKNPPRTLDTAIIWPQEEPWVLSTWVQLIPITVSDNNKCFYTTYCFIPLSSGVG